MPDLRMTFVHPDALDNVSLHPCVRIPRWESEKALSFVPPDGKFKLLSYRVGPYAIQYGLPIHLSGKSTLEDNIYNIEITVGAAQLLYSKSAIGGMGHTGMPVLPTSSARERKLEDVRVVLPLPTTAYNIRMQTKKGTYSVDQSMSDQTKLTWELKTIGPNDSNIKLHAQFSVKRQHQDSTLALAAFAQFKLVGVSVSSVKINSLRMLRETYNIFKGVKTITKAGSFQVRL
ncbi:AP-3 complex subunit mu-2 [Spiromyces aspiralis]|uniref:AP-3 complex subunit mu-2 n=1 Tax=Spiromyces aspiralis TaxID=68401 RepID=A0ACC1HGK4_9FUNG|nr:AP-3 complex subunit mu-2 [Spiromyces aspiralis]